MITSLPSVPISFGDCAQRALYHVHNNDTLCSVSVGNRHDNLVDVNKRKQNKADDINESKQKLAVIETG